MIAALAEGQAVRVGDGPMPGHVRTPRYLRGQRGQVLEVVGAYPDPTRLARGEPGLPYRMLYRIVFEAAQVWPDYSGPANDQIVADIYEHWLAPAGEQE